MNRSGKRSHSSEMARMALMTGIGGDPFEPR